MDQALFNEWAREELEAHGFFKDGQPQFATVVEFGRLGAQITAARRQIKEALTPEQLKGAVEEIQAAMTPPIARESLSPEQASLQRDLEKLQQRLDAADALILEQKQQAEAKARETAVIDALEAAGALNSRRDHVHLSNSSLERDEAGNLWFVDGEEWISVQDAAARFIAANPELGRSRTAGAPASPTQKPGTTGQTFATNAEAMRYYAQNRDRIVSGELPPPQVSAAPLSAQGEPPAPKFDRKRYATDEAYRKSVIEGAPR